MKQEYRKGIKMNKIIVGVKCDGYDCNEDGERKDSDSECPECGNMIEVEVDLDIDFDIKFIDCDCGAGYKITVDGSRKRVVVRKR